MAELGIFDDEKKKWVQFDSDTEVLLKFLDREALVKIREQGEKTAKRTGVYIDNATNLIIGRRSVFGWRKIGDDKHPGLMVGGKPLEFTQKNLDILMLKCSEFSKFVNESCGDSRLFMEAEDIDLDIGEAEGDDPKNG